MKKKITGIRKSSSLKETLVHNSPMKKDKINEECKKMKRTTEKKKSKSKIKICKQTVQEKLIKVQ